ncbi:hypothetical protein RJ639_025130 [Escallonia herrerae]|uniref:AP2/ERF domain-containing protein n=1 Tax=Escallonia herrerae TaxID=1293975 RepID=A0AA88RVQ3_9ASTE|nr:hypothetical protein RJ639_025130 [Escallonia herrerae]
MASSSSEPQTKAEAGGSGSGGGGGAGSGGGGEPSETAAAGLDQVFLYRGLKKAKKERGCTAKERISKMPPCAAGKRSSIYRGVTRHRWTGRYEAHLWDKSAYDDEEAAARAYDLAALKYWGPGTLINFPVTDYTRDLEEMQNVSREDYLASLRRKSSGFSRGISKYRGLSSRWDSSFGHMAGADYFNKRHHGDDATESEYGGSFGLDRKIDLTSYIKWWGPNRTRHLDSHAKSLEETKHGCSEDIGSELKALEWGMQPTEPYQMPSLGVPQEGKKHKRPIVSAMSILSRSAAYKSLQEKASKDNEIDTENDENENKNTISKKSYGKAVEKSLFDDGGTERLGVALEMDAVLPVQRNAYTLAPFLSAPLLTNYNSIDPLTDPALWTSLVPVLPTGSSRPVEVGICHSVACSISKYNCRYLQNDIKDVSSDILLALTI